MTQLIRGSGGAFGGRRSKPKRQSVQIVSEAQPIVTEAVYTPVEDPDNLNSSQYATILDLISEGEIEGLKNGAQSVFIDNTPLQNPDGSYNFNGVTLVTRNGTQNQSYIPITADVSNSKPVGSTVQYNAPITRTITDTSVNAVRVSITVPALQTYTDKGDILGASFDLRIEIQHNGGGYVPKLIQTISGRSGDQFQRDYVIQLSGAFPVDVRVVRASADSNSNKVQNAFSWTSYTEIIYAKLRYPNSALIALQVSADQFSSIPSRSYLIRGIKIKIPSNATVDSKTGRLIYTGIWNGTFGAAQWCSDPAWILWDLLTSTRYGFGDHVNLAQLDRWAFYSASQYASALVPDGFGGYEPRFSCNVNIQTQDEAYKLINDLCSVFRAMPCWAAGALTISQDAPKDPAYLFTLANVAEGGFNYQSSSIKSRSTVAVVSYLNLDKRDTDYEVVEDQDNIARYGVVTQEVTAFACTSRGQAHRLGEFLVYAEWNEPEVVSFTASIDAGVMVRPGQVINISDPMRVGSRRSGRISAATTTAITVDDATGLTMGAAPSLSCVMPDGSVQTRAVSSISGAIFTVAGPFTVAPNANSVWLYEKASTWRVLTVQEQDGSSYAITALAYNSSKYDYIERNVPLESQPVTNLNTIPDAPTNLQAVETLYESNGRSLAKLILSWRAAPGVTEYRVRWKPQNGNWTSVEQSRLDAEILDVTSGLYAIEVYSIGDNLRYSLNAASITVQAFGKTAPPASPTGVSLVPIDSASAVLSWDRSNELDVLLGGKVLIRHSAAVVGATWEQSQEIIAAAAGSQTQKQIPLLDGTYLIKFEDDGGRRSLSAASVVVRLPAPQPRLLIQSYAEELEPFSGNFNNMFYSPGLREIGGAAGIGIASGTNIDDMAANGNWDGLASIDSIGGILPSGEYEFGSTYGFPGVFDVNLKRRLSSMPYIVGQYWDDKTDLIDDWDLVDGISGDRINVATYMRVTQDDPAATPTWSGWQEFSNAIIRGRGFQFKAVATSDDPAQNVIVTQLGVDMELQQRTEQSAALTSGTGVYAVTFANPFFQAPSVGITAYDMESGDFYAVTAITATGFLVAFKNSAAAGVSRQFTYTAIGFGRQF